MIAEIRTGVIASLNVDGLYIQIILTRSLIGLIASLLRETKSKYIIQINSKTDKKRINNNYINYKFMII